MVNKLPVITPHEGQSGALGGFRYPVCGHLSKDLPGGTGLHAKTRPARTAPCRGSALSLLRRTGWCARGTRLDSPQTDPRNARAPIRPEAGAGNSSRRLWRALGRADYAAISRDSAAINARPGSSSRLKPDCCVHRYRIDRPEVWALSPRRFAAVKKAGSHERRYTTIPTTKAVVSPVPAARHVPTAVSQWFDPSDAPASPVAVPVFERSRCFRKVSSFRKPQLPVNRVAVAPKRS